MPRRDIITVHPDKLHPNPDNPRYEAGNVTDLAKSITEDQLLQPLMVIHAPQFGPGHFLIEDGLRRWTAAKATGTPLDCIIQYRAEAESTAFRAVITALITDIHKEPLNAIERAKAYARLRDEFGMTQREIAKRLHFTETTIGRYLSLSELSDKSQRDVLSGKLSVDNAVKAVKMARGKKRVQSGKKPIEVGWEPDHFTSHHHLAKKAKNLCDAREHNRRRRLGGVACGQCFEDAIRQDQTTVLQQAYLDAQREGNNPVFMPPFMTANGIKEGVVGNAST